MPKKNKQAPRFRVGQVVAYEGDYRKIVRVIRADADYTFYDVGGMYNATQNQLRPLTAREIGNRRKSNA